MRHTIPFILFALLLTACAQTSTAPAGAESDVIKIGVIAPMSGDLAFAGEGMRNSIELALKELNGTKYRYEAIYEDDQFNPAKSVAAAQKLIAQDHVDVLVSAFSSTGNAVSPIAQEHQVIHIGFASDVAVAEGEYNFIHWTQPEEEAQKWTAEAQRRGYKRIAVITMQHQGAEAVLQSVHAELENTGMEVVSEQTVAIDDTDFKTVILKARQSEPDVYLVEVFDPALSLLYKQMKDAGIQQPISSIETFEISNNPSQFEGEWYVNAADANGNFHETYTAAYGKTPTLATGNAYDAVHLVVHAYETAGTAGKPTTAEAAAVLSALRDYPSTLGLLTADAEGVIRSEAVVRTIEDGKPVTVR